VGGLAYFFARDLVLGGYATFWIAAALVGALLGATRLRPLLLLAASALALLWLAVAVTPLSARLARPLVRRDAPRPADAILVLGSSLQDDGEATAVAQARLLHGLERLAEGAAPRLVVTEQEPGTAHRRLAETTMGRLKLGGEVLSMGPVETTRDEAVQAGALCRARGWARLVVVTSPTHSRRGCAALEREGVAVTCSPAVETAFDLETLVQPMQRFTAFRAALHEWAGLWVYRRRGWLADRPAGL
jgi:uncharacterized SAM-binding protein YcdF (DUF218 family)